MIGDDLAKRNIWKDCTISGKSGHNIFRALESEGDDHKGVVLSIRSRYEQAGKHVSTGRRFRDCLIDVQVHDDLMAEPSILIEVETEVLVTAREAKAQWVNYSRAYDKWWLAVPTSCIEQAERLLRIYSINNCTTIGWWRTNRGYSFSVLPGFE